MWIKKLSFFLLLLTIPLFAEEGTVSYETALDLYKKGEYSQSSALIKALHVAGNTTYLTWYLDAHNQYKIGKTKTATARFYKALEVKPNEPVVVMDLAKLLLKRNQVSEAVEVLDQAAIAHPDVIDIKLLQALAYYRNKKPKGALQIIEQVKSLKQNSIQPLLLEALVYYRLGEYDKSEVSLKWAMEINSTNVEVLNNLGLVYEKLALQAEDQKNSGEKRKKLEDARYYLEKARELDSNNTSVSKNLERIIQRMSES